MVVQRDQRPRSFEVIEVQGKLAKSGWEVVGTGTHEDPPGYWRQEARNLVELKWGLLLAAVTSRSREASQLPIPNAERRLFMWGFGWDSFADLGA